MRTVSTANPSSSAAVAILINGRRGGRFVLGFLFIEGSVSDEVRSN